MQNKKKKKVKKKKKKSQFQGFKLLKLQAKKSEKFRELVFHKTSKTSFWAHFDPLNFKALDYYNFMQKIRNVLSQFFIKQEKLHFGPKIWTSKQDFCVMLL